MSRNYDVIVIFPIYGQFGTIWKPDSCIVIEGIRALFSQKILKRKKQKFNFKQT